MLEISVDLVDLNNKLGQIHSAYIVLQGLGTALDTHFVVEDNLATAILGFSDKNSERIDLKFDYLEDTKLAHQDLMLFTIEMQTLIRSEPLGWWSRAWEEYHVYNVLILSRVEGVERNMYTRVGMGTISMCTIDRAPPKS